MGENFLMGKRVGVLMGGPGSEREVSLRSGAAVSRALRECGIEVFEVEVRGREIDLPEGLDLVFNVIHGEMGEDGELQSFLEEVGVPYTGDGVEASRRAFDKLLSKKRFEEAGIPSPRWQKLEAGRLPKWEPPFVLKAPRQGSSVGVHIIFSKEEIEGAVMDCLRYGPELIIEEYIVGRELTVGILGEEALPVVEIRPRAGFYDFKNKYTQGATEYFVPAKLRVDEARGVQEAALAAHRALGLEVYSRVDILMAEGGRLAVLEANTIPGMTETSLLPKAAAAAGMSFKDLCLRIAELSMARFEGREREC